MSSFDSLVFNEIRGKMGNMIFQGGTSGPIVRRNAKQKSSQTAPQMAVRASFSDANIAWAAADALTKLTWANAAKQVTLINKVGKPYKPTGRRLFISCFQNSATVGQDGPTTAPALVPLVPGVSDFGATAFAPGTVHKVGEITLTGTFDAANYAFAIRMTGPLSPDRSKVGPSDFRVLATVAAGGLMPTPAILGSLYVARFGQLAAGVQMMVEVFAVNADGFASVVSRAEVLVSA